MNLKEKVLVYLLMLEVVLCNHDYDYDDFDEDNIVYAKVVSCAKCKLRDNPEVRAFIFEDLDR